MSVSKIQAEENIQSLIKWKWNADCIIMYKNGDWTIDSWDSPSITQPSKDEIKAIIIGPENEKCSMIANNNDLCDLCMLGYEEDALEHFNNEGSQLSFDIDVDYNLLVFSSDEDYTKISKKYIKHLDTLNKFFQNMSINKNVKLKK